VACGTWPYNSRSLLGQTLSPRRAIRRSPATRTPHSRSRSGARLQHRSPPKRRRNCAGVRSRRSTHLRGPSFVNRLLTRLTTSSNRSIRSRRASEQRRVGWTRSGLAQPGGPRTPSAGAFGKRSVFSSRGSAGADGLGTDSCATSCRGRRSQQRSAAWSGSLSLSGGPDRSFESRQIAKARSLRA
jgi:hypothetical protein